MPAPHEKRSFTNRNLGALAKARERDKEDGATDSFAEHSRGVGAVIPDNSPAGTALREQPRKRFAWPVYPR